MRGRRTARTSLRPGLLERIAPDVLDLSPTLFANGNRTANIARARELLGAVPRVAGPEEKKAATPDEPRDQLYHPNLFIVYASGVGRLDGVSWGRKS